MNDNEYKECHQLAEAFILDMEYQKIRNSGDMEDWYRECVLEWLPCLDPEEFTDEEVQEFSLEAERAAIDYLHAHGERLLAKETTSGWNPLAPSRAKKFLGTFRAFMKEQIRLLFGDEDGYNAWVMEDAWC